MNGRVTSSIYGWERSGDSYWRGYIGLNSTTTLLQRGANRSLDFHNNLRSTGSLSTSERGVPQTYIYDFYLRLSGYPAGTAFYLGRQFAYNSLGSSLIDGLRAKLQIHRSVSIDLFGGSTVTHESPDKLRSFGDYSLVGSRVDYTTSRSFRFALNWLARKSHGSVSSHRVGLDGYGQVGRTDFFGRISYDILALDIADALARVTSRPSDWSLSAEAAWRKPSVDGNTIFSLIDADPYKGIRAEITRAVRRDLRLLGRAHLELLGDDEAWRTVFGLRTARFMIAWHHRSGYGGESDGIQGQAGVNLRSDLEVYGTALLSRYLIQPETPDKMDAYSSGAGLLWKPGRSLQVRLEGQYLRDAVDKNDWRIFLQLAKGFQLKGAGE